MQEWLGNDLDPTLYGWSLEEDELKPRQGFKEICPKEIAKEFRCGCKTGCSTKICSCFKSNVKCTDACKCGDSCENNDPTVFAKSDDIDLLDSSSDSEVED